MSRNQMLLLGGGFITLLMLFLFYFLNNYRYIEENVWRGLQGEAQGDRYYLAEQFLTQKGYAVTRQKNYARLQGSDLTDYDTLFFTNDARTLSQTQMTAVLDWVKKGGHVVIYAGAPAYENDASSRPQGDSLFEPTNNRINLLLKQSGISVVRCSGDDCECPEMKQSRPPGGACGAPDSEANEDATPEEKALQAEIEAILNSKNNDNNNENKIEESNRPSIDEAIDALIAVEHDRYTTTFRLGGKTLTLYERSTDWLYADKDGTAQLDFVQAARCYGDIFAVFSVGGGKISVYNLDYDYFSNQVWWKGGEAIWSYHNATFLDALLQIGNGKRVLWYESGVYPNIWSFVRQYGMFAVMTALLLLLAWIWRHSRRFGSLIVEDKRQGLTLERHLRATGQFYYQNEQTNTLLQHCYERLDTAIATRIASPKRLKRTELAEKIAEKTGLPAETIANVLARRYPKTDSEFTQLIYTINQIQQRL